MSRRLLVLLVTAGCGGGSDCFVDETGYLVCEGDAASGEDDDNPLDGMPETDDARADRVLYTASAPLGDAPAPVTVIGLPGAIDRAEVVRAWVAPAGAPVDAVVSGDAFVVTLDARLGDTVVVVTGEGAAVASVLLDDDLADAEAPASDAGGGVGASLDLAFEDGEGGAPGEVPVGDGDLPGVVAPYVAYVVERGASVLVEAGDADATLPAARGETLCLVGLQAGGATSVATCVTVGG